MLLACNFIRNNVYVTYFFTTFYYSFSLPRQSLANFQVFWNTRISVAYAYIPWLIKIRSTSLSIYNYNHKKICNIIAEEKSIKDKPRVYKYLYILNDFNNDPMYIYIQTFNSTFHLKTQNIKQKECGFCDRIR